MIRSYFNEQWKEVEFGDNVSDEIRYKISNLGRVIKITKEGEELQEKRLGNGYEMIRIKLKNGVWSSRYTHKILAENLIRKNKKLKFETKYKFKRKLLR